MQQAETLAQLRQKAAQLRAMGITALYLFGSTARNEAHSGSDIDLFLDYNPQQGFSLLDLVSIKHQLEAELAQPVDITTRDSLHPLLRAEIEQSAIQVF